MKTSSKELRGSMIRRQLEGRVTNVILSQMTNIELAEEKDFFDSEKIRRMELANYEKTI